MAGIKSVLTKGLDKFKDTPNDDSAIKELVSKAFATRNALHFAHWATKSYAQHGAVGGLYDAIIEIIDDIIETYQGKFGIIKDLSSCACSVPSDICGHVKSEAEWVESNRSRIAGGMPSIENLVDSLVGAYHKTVYKLENLS
jgi:hypothetical protein